MIKYICDICKDEITSSNVLDTRFNKFTIMDKNNSKIGAISIEFISHRTVNKICQNCFNTEIQNWLDNPE